MYTKLFDSITDSTIWREEDHTRIVWITMLAMADKYGHVMASVPGLADRARVSIEKTMQALKKLSAPDEWSRSIEHEGRRIDKIGGGWVLLNYVKYSKIRDAEERKAYMRKYMREYRKQNVSNVSHSKPGLAHTDVDLNPTVLKSSIQDYGNKEYKKGGGVKNPPPQFSQEDFDERDWRKISEARKLILSKMGAAIGGESLTEQQYFQWLSEESGVVIRRVMKLCKQNGVSNETG